MTDSSTDRLDAESLQGRRCSACDHVVLGDRPRCPDCGEQMIDTAFPGRGTVWSSTVVRVPLRAFPDPQVLAYVDLDAGPRVLVRVEGPSTAPTPGSRVRSLDPLTTPPTFEVAE